MTADAVEPAASNRSRVIPDLVVLHQGAIGDFMLTLSVVQPLREHISARRVLAIATSPAAKLAAGRSAIDAWRPPDDLGVHTLFRDGGGLDDRLAEVLRSADCVVSFLGSTSDPVHGHLSRVTSGRVISIDPRPTRGTIAARVHITSQWVAVAREAGFAIEAPTPPVLRLERGPQAAGPRVVIHPGSGGRRKCWPLDRFMALADGLAGVTVSWMLGPAEGERAELVAALRARATAAGESLILEEELETAAQRIAGSPLFVGNDSGMTHLAAAIGVPTVAIFGPTDPRAWRPLGQHVAIVAPPAGAQPEASVPLDDVLRKVRSVLAV